MLWEAIREGRLGRPCQLLARVHPIAGHYGDMFPARFAGRPDLLVTLDAVGALFGFLEGRQQHGDQEGDNGNDHKQFDEGKSTFATHKRAPWQRLAHILTGMCSFLNVSRVKS